MHFCIAYFVLPALVKKRRDIEPEITVEILATNESSDLPRREADIAIRNFQPKHAELIARKSPNMYVFFYVTAEYLLKMGNPQTLTELNKCEFIGFSGNASYITGLNSLRLIPDFIGDNEPQVKRISNAIPNFPPIETWLVVHRELRTSRHVRYVFDFLIQELKSP